MDINENIPAVEQEAAAAPAAVILTLNTDLPEATITTAAGTDLTIITGPITTQVGSINLGQDSSLTVVGNLASAVLVTEGPVEIHVAPGNHFEFGALNPDQAVLGGQPEHQAE